MSRRGPYKRYLKDLAVPIPYSTRKRRNEEANCQVARLNDDSHSESGNSDKEMGETIEAQENRSFTENCNTSPLPETPLDVNNDFPSQDSRPTSENSNSDPESEHDVSDSEFTAANNGGCFMCSGDEADFYEDSSRSGDSDDSDFNDFEDVGSCESDSNDGSFEEIGEHNERILLYEGSNITREESELLILSYAMRFGLSDIALQSLIDLIDSHLPRQEHKSLYRLMKNSPKTPEVEVHYYCDSCKNIVVFSGVKEVTCACSKQCKQEDLKTNHCFFMRIPLKEQLISLLQDENLHSTLEKAKACTQSDVHNGRVYKKLIQRDTVSSDDLTLQWNTDGVKVFQSSNITMWPVQVALNNLPYKERRDNIMLCGVWYGHKPTADDMNMFLKPFQQELEVLHTEGLEYIIPKSGLIKTVLVHSLLCSVDSQARPILQNIKLHRGRFGCSFCLHEGTEFAVGRGNARIYRGDMGTLRTHEQHVKDTSEVIRTKEAKNGIKGPSVLLLLPLFNIITSFVPDYMHCCLLGVGKSMVEWWMDRANKSKPFYFGSASKKQKIDEVLLSIKPPTELTRTPNSISEYKLWKASEWKHFLLYYSLPCLKHIAMPKKFLQHWFLFVTSLTIFLKEKISSEEFVIAEKSMRKFVLTMEDIYHAPQLMRFNVHLLLHIPKSVKDFGALWAVSCFPYEHYNGLLAKMFRSSQAVPQQICKFYLRLQSLKQKTADILKNKETPEHVKKLYESLSDRKHISGYCTLYGKHIRLFGKPDILSLSLTLKAAIENFLKESVKNQHVCSFQKFISKNVLYHVKGHQRLKRRNNYIVALRDGTIIALTHALIVPSLVNNREKCVLLGLRMRKTNKVICEDRNLHISSQLLCNIIEMTPEYVAFYPDMIRSKCVSVPYQNDECVYMLVNSLERD